MGGWATKQDKPGSRRRAFRLVPLAMAAFMLCLLAAACLSPVWKGDGNRPLLLLLAAAPGSGMPAIALADYGGGTGVLVLIPGGKGDAQALEAALKDRGAETVDALFVPAYSPCHRGAAEWVAGWPVRQAYLTDKSRSSADFSPLLDAAAEGRITLSRLQPQEGDGAEERAAAWSALHNGWTWRYQHWPGGAARCTIRPPASQEEYCFDACATGECTVSCMTADGASRLLLTIPRCNRLQRHTLPLEQQRP